MGLAVGAQILTRLLDTVFHDVKFKFVFNYLDDLLVYSKGYKEHLGHLEDVMCRLRSAGLTVNPEKVKFAQTQISFLGHLISHRGVTVDPERTQGIRDFPHQRMPKASRDLWGWSTFTDASFRMLRRLRHP